MAVIFIRNTRNAGQGARIIDVTPGARWKTTLRNVGIGLALLVLVPLLWLVAGVVVLGLIGVGFLVFTAFFARTWWLQRAASASQARPPADVGPGG